MYVENSFEFRGTNLLSWCWNSEMKFWEPLLLNAFNLEPGSWPKRWGCIESKFHVVVYASRHHGHGIHLKGRQVDITKYDELLFILIPWLTALEVLPSPKNGPISYSNRWWDSTYQSSEVSWLKAKIQETRRFERQGWGKHSPCRCLISFKMHFFSQSLFFFWNFFKVPRRSRCCSCDFSNHCTLYEWTKTPGDL